MTSPGSPAVLNAGSLTQLMLSLVLVVALIFAVSWLLKRFKLNMPRASRTMEIIDQLSIGPRERVLLLRVGDSQVLLGVGNGGVVSLTPLAAPMQLPPPATDGSFSSRLRDYMRSGSSQ